MFKIGQRVDYKRRGKVMRGEIVGIDEGSLAGRYYWVRHDASQIRMAVLPSQIVRSSGSLHPPLKTVSTAEGWESQLQQRGMLYR